jgi:hypothetical protein
MSFPSVPRVPPAAPALLLLLVALVTVGCAHGGPGEGGARSGPNVLEREDFAELHYADAYEIVARLRPRWLRARGFGTLRDSSANLPVVYRDERLLGEPGSLRDIDFDTVVRIEYISASDSTTRFGTGHSGGVILVTTSRAP